MPPLVLISTRDFPAGRGGGFDLYNLAQPLSQNICLRTIDGVS